MTKKKEFTADIKEDFNIRETPNGFELNKELKSKLLELQMNTASNGNAEMLKWLGQQYLGQSTNKHEVPDNTECPLVFCYETGKDCPVHKYLEHIGEFGTERYKQFMKDNYAEEE